MSTAEFKGQPVITLQTKKGAKAVVLLQGAQLIAWQPESGIERIFLSDQAFFEAGKAVRGGVPVCFPQFGMTGPLAQHGFARNQVWEFVDQRSDADSDLLVLALTDNETTRAVWPYAFRIEMTISLTGERLDMELEVQNTGEESFNFTAALHTYLHVQEVEHSSIEGLRDLTYFDNITKLDVVETGTALVIDAETDRVYRNATRPLLVRDGNLALGVHAEGFPDVVVWNPWVDRAKAIPDMADREFRSMLCVEAAAYSPISLPAGESWWGRQTLAALN